VYHWDRGAGTDNWADGANWYNSLSSRNNTVPLANMDVVFGSRPSGSGPQVVNQDTANFAIRSLWFETGRDYTLQGTGSLLFAYGPIIIVAEGGHAGNRYTLDLPLQVGSNSGAVDIANYSSGLLDIRRTLNLNSNNSLNLHGGVIPLDSITGSLSSSIIVGGLSDQLTSVIYRHHSGLNWQVANNGLLILKGGALSALHVLSSGTVALHSNNNVAITASGEGIARQEGAARIGTIYNEGGDNSLQGITLTGDTTIGGRAGLADNLTISTIQGHHLLTKVGAGLVSFTTAAWSSSGIAATEIQGGAFRTRAWHQLGNIRLNGGVLEYRDQGSISSKLGTAGGQMQWLGDGGFSSFYGNLSLTLNSGAELTWGQQYFVQDDHALLFGSRYATASVTFTNALKLGDGLREVRVAGNFAPRATMSGTLSGTGGILKTGSGILDLTGANTYTGPTRISDGVLRGASDASNIQLDGGLLWVSGSITVQIGAGADEIQWLGNGGFYINSSTSINFGGPNTPLNWGDPYFVQSGKELRIAGGGD